MNFCNNYADVCSSFDLIFEYTASGLVLCKSNIYLYRVDRNWKTVDLIRNIFEGLIGGIMVYFIIDLVLRVRKEGCKVVCLSFWTILRVLIIVMLIIKIMLILVYSNLYEVKNFDPDTDEFKDYESIAYYYSLINNFVGVIAFFAYFSILSFLQKSKSLKVIWGTLRTSMYKLIFFFFVFILVFIGWILLAYRGFGQYSSGYKDYGTTVSTLLQMLLGNIDFDDIYNIQPAFAAIFFILFIFLSFFVMLNIFLAIINESYDTYYKKIHSTDEKDEMMVIIGIIFRAVKQGICVYPWKLVTCNFHSSEKPKNKLREEFYESDMSKSEDTSQITTSRRNSF